MCFPLARPHLLGIPPSSKNSATHWPSVQICGACGHHSHSKHHRNKPICKTLHPEKSGFPLNILQWTEKCFTKRIKYSKTAMLYSYLLSIEPVSSGGRNQAHNSQEAWKLKRLGKIIKATRFTKFLLKAITAVDNCWGKGWSSAELPANWAGSSRIQFCELSPMPLSHFNKLTGSPNWMWVKLIL